MNISACKYSETRPISDGFKNNKVYFFPLGQQKKSPQQIHAAETSII